ncbi:MAG: hypothetical protein ABIR71_06615 [Chthoniobacterales bacterium]
MLVLGSGALAGMMRLRRRSS